MSLQDSNLLFLVVVFRPYLNSPGTQSRVPIEYQQTASNWQKRDPNLGFLTPGTFTYLPWVPWCKFNLAGNPTIPFDQFGPGKVLWDRFISCISNSFKHYMGLPAWRKGLGPAPWSPRSLFLSLAPFGSLSADPRLPWSKVSSAGSRRSL